MLQLGKIGMRVVAADGCAGGWAAMCWDVEQVTVTAKRHEILAGLIDLFAVSRCDRLSIQRMVSS